MKPRTMFVATRHAFWVLPGSISIAVWALFWVAVAVVPLSGGRTPLHGRIAEIVSLRSLEQVLWSDTRPDITVVADQQPIVDGAIPEFVGNAMHRLRCAGILNGTISAASDAACPYPTTSRWVGDELAAEHVQPFLIHGALPVRPGNVNVGATTPGRVAFGSKPSPDTDYTTESV